MITPDAGYEFALDTLAWTMRRSATGPVSFQWRSSLDAFATPFATFSLPDTTANVRLTVSSLGTLFADLVSPVTFRLYGFAAEGPLGTFRLGISSSDAGSPLPDNLTVTGDLSPRSPSPLQCSLRRPVWPRRDSGAGTVGELPNDSGARNEHRETFWPVTYDASEAKLRTLNVRRRARVRVAEEGPRYLVSGFLSYGEFST